MTERIEAIDVALGDLTDAQRTEADRLMRDDAAFRAEVEELRSVAHALEDLPEEAWDPPTPPPLALPPEAAEPARSKRGSLFRLPALRWPAVAAAAACAIAIVAVAIGFGVLAGDDDAGGGSTVALAPVDAAGAGTGTATVVDGSDIEFDVAGLPASSPNDEYELWLLNSPEDLVSLGTFRVEDDGAATVRVSLPDNPEQFAFYDISVEPTDGNPAHSGNSVLRAPTV